MMHGSPYESTSCAISLDEYHNWSEMDIEDIRIVSPCTDVCDTRDVVDPIEQPVDGIR